MFEKQWTFKKVRAWGRVYEMER